MEIPVNVKVIDRSMPVFDKQFYTDSVLESIEVHSPLALSIQAESPLNRKLIYSITKGNDFEEFALDFNTGENNLIILMMDRIQVSINKWSPESERESLFEREFVNHRLSRL